VPPPPEPPKAIVVLAVSDISCDPASKFYNARNGTAKSASCLPLHLAISLKPQAALLLGDTQYDTGNLSAFEQSYAKTWGRKELKDISY
jgi:hypothetical protein